MEHKIIRWIKAHPLLAMAHAAFTASVATFAGCNYQDKWVVIPAFGIIISQALGAMFGVWLARLGILLALLTPQPAKAQAIQPAGSPLGGYILGGAVIVVGGVVIYKVAKWCQKKFPKTKPQETNAPPGEVSMFGMAFTQSADYCIEPAAEAALIPTRLVEIEIVDDKLAIGSYGEEELTTDWAGELALFGLSMDFSQPAISYSWNNQPALPQQVPISIQDSTIVIEDSDRLVHVEHSLDLQNWTTLARIQYRSGARAIIQDVVTGIQGFYRLKTSTTP